jgi:hypothetical protein
MADERAVKAAGMNGFRDAQGSLFGARASVNAGDPYPHFCADGSDFAEPPPVFGPNGPPFAATRKSSSRLARVGSRR